jgi:hypothetical protein
VAAAWGSARRTGWLPACSGRANPVGEGEWAGRAKALASGPNEALTLPDLRLTRSGSRGSSPAFLQIIGRGQSLSGAWW